MVLNDLGRKISQALGGLHSVDIIDEGVFKKLLKEVGIFLCIFRQDQMLLSCEETRYIKQMLIFYSLKNSEKQCEKKLIWKMQLLE